MRVKAQASDVICKWRLIRAANQIRENVVLDVPVRVYAGMYVCLYAYVREMNICMLISNQHAHVQVIYDNTTHACYPVHASHACECSVITD